MFKREREKNEQLRVAEKERMEEKKEVLERDEKIAILEAELYKYKTEIREQSTDHKMKKNDLLAKKRTLSIA